jgi:hypothetical protein
MLSSDILTKERIITPLDSLNQRLTAKGVTGELCIFGGATMILAFDARESTRAVVAVFVPKTEIYEEAAKIAEEMKKYVDTFPEDLEPKKPWKFPVLPGSGCGRRALQMESLIC